MSLDQDIAAYLAQLDARDLIRRLSAERTALLLQIKRDTDTITRLTAEIEKLKASSTLPVFDPADRVFMADFLNPGPFRSMPGDGESNDGVWWVARKAVDRISVIRPGRLDAYCLRLHTEPGDSNVSGSNAAERADVSLTKNARGYENRVHWGVHGQEQWWAHSILLPDDFYVAPDGWAVLFDFHDDRNAGGQANFHVFANPNGLSFRGHAGPTVIGDNNDWGGNQFSYGGDIIAPLMRNVWIDFVYRVKWSWGSDGYFHAWVNGEKKLTHQGPTLYQNYGVYLKLANYHSAHGRPSTVLHDRVIRGRTWQSAALSALKGV